jgi:threonine/homoserine/homoserine lactone efflux protein
VNPLGLFAGAFVVGLSGAMSPGPVLTATVSASIRRGFMAGPLIVLGHALLEMGLLAFVVAGCGKFLQQPPAPAVLGLAGGAVLVAMGIATIRDSRGFMERSMAATAGGTAEGRGMHPVLAGVLLSLSNPTWILWWATVGLAFASQAMAYGLPGLGAFYAGHVMSDLVWYSLVSAAVAGGRRVAPPGVWRAVLAVCGFALCGLGILFAVGGLRSAMAAQPSGGDRGQGTPLPTLNVRCCPWNSRTTPSGARPTTRRPAGVDCPTSISALSRMTLPAPAFPAMTPRTTKFGHRMAAGFVTGGATLEARTADDSGGGVFVDDAGAAVGAISGPVSGPGLAVSAIPAATFVESTDGGTATFPTDFETAGGSGRA